MQTGPTATVHLGNIVANWRLLADRAAPGEAGAVVKADAYGHGGERVSAALARAGCRTFFVAYAKEGAAVRRAVGAEADIYVFNGTGNHTLVEDLTPVINSAAELKAWLETGRPYALHVDTGMNRLGLPWREAGGLADSFTDHPPRLLLSHFACADEPDHTFNETQRERFAALSARLPHEATSLANTAAHWLGAPFHGDVTRPGIGLYGGGTSPLRDERLLPGMTLEAPILSVFDAPAGDTVGYGATAILSGDTPRRLATVALGYSDGFLRSASNSGSACLGATRCAILGRVSMDLITIDVTAAGGLAKPGAKVEFIGASVGLETQAAAAGTLGYELVSGLGHRVERIYRT